MTNDTTRETSVSRRFPRRFRWWKRRAGAAAMLLPGAVLLGLLFYWPVGAVFWEAFTAGAPSAMKGVAALFGSVSAVASRLRDVLADDFVRRLLTTTAWQATLSAGASIAIGVPLASLMVHRRFRGKQLISSFMMVPFVMPTVTVALGFLITFGANGWLNTVWHGLFGWKWQVLHSLRAVVLAHAFYNAPLVARMTENAWRRLDPALAESAAMLGARPWRVWKDVTVPAILPGVISGGLLAFVFSFMSFPIVLTLGGARFSTLETEIYTQIRVLFDYETGAILAALQALISFAFAYFFLRVEGDRAVAFASAQADDLFEGAQTRHVSSSKSRARRFTSGARSVGTGLFIVGLCLLFIGPIAGVVSSSLTDPKGGFTWASYARIITGGHDIHLGATPVQSIVNSLRNAALASVTSLLAGTTFVYGMVRLVRRRSVVLETLSLAPLVVSSIAFAYGISVAFRHPPLGILPADMRIPVVHAVLGFPFVVRAFRPVIQGIDVRLAEAARTLGAGRWRAFFDVELPLVFTGLLVAFALSFGLSMSEMSAALMLSGPRQVTMPVSVYRFLSARDFHGAAAMAVLLMVVSGGVFFTVERLSARIRRAAVSDGDA